MKGALRSMLWKEWRELQRSRSGLSGRLAGIVLPLGVMGVLLPWQFGRAWVETPVGLGFWCWVSLLMVTPLAADTIAGERERHTLETLLSSPLPDRAILLGKAAAATLYGSIMGTAAAILALVTVNITRWSGTIVSYRPETFLCGLLLSFLTAGLGAGAGILISMRAPTVRQAQQTLSLIVLLFALAPLFSAWLVPAPWWSRVAAAGDRYSPLLVLLMVLAGLGIADAILLSLAARRFQRHRLLLD